MSVPQEARMLHHEPHQFLRLKRWMKTQMEPLTQRPGKITFPPCLSVAARKCGHQVAGSLKLKHDSCGDGASRCLVVFNDTDLGAEQPSLKRERTQESTEERANSRAKAARMRKGKAKGEDKGNGKVGKGGKDQKARSKSKGQGKGGKDEEEVVMLEDMWVLGDGIMINEQSTWSRQWQCPRCTLINEESFKVCPICDLDRAIGKTVDAEAATDENAATPSERLA